MRECRIQRRFAVQVKVLRHNRNDSHEHPQETVLEDANPNDLSEVSHPSHVIGPLRAYIKPSQTTPRNSPDAMFPSAALLHPVQRPDPLFRFDSTEVILLAM